VLLQEVSTIQGPGLAYEFISDGLAVVQYGGYLRLLYANRNDSRISSIVLSDTAATPNPGAGDPAIGAGPGADIAVQGNATADRAFVFSRHDGHLRSTVLGADGLPGLTKPVQTDQGYIYGLRAMEIIERGATDLAVMAQRGVPGLRLFSVSSAGDFTLTSTMQDTAKSYLGDVADMAAVNIGGRDFLLTASALENGVSLFEVDEAGQMSFVDAIGAGDGLAVSGPAALQSVKIGDTQYVVLASTLSSSLSVLRVNEMGVLFVTDHRVDDRITRFDNVAALDMFSYAGRVFVATGGTDSGVTVMELLPDGRLSHMLSKPLETGAGIGTITGVEAEVVGGKALIFLTVASGDRIHRFEVDLAGIGGLVQAGGGTTTGSALDDRMIGSGLADTLQGGAGDDFLHDGGGGDLLFGGAGADVFVFDRDGSADRIGDFQDGIDLIDVSAWGRIYSAQALDIRITGSGAVVSYGAEVLTITKAGPAPLVLTDDDFVFLS
jgi:Ca2+-binding RTX toxin-like protein